MKNLPMIYLLLLSLSFIPLNAQAQGHLVIIGGGDKTDTIMHEIINLAGGKDAKIIVIPNASSEPIESGQYNVDEFIKIGCPDVSYLYCNREGANQDSIIKKLNGVTGIFFGGGDQAFLTRDLLGTKLLEAIKKIFKNGGVVSGTSAGAAVMSELMITGNELINKDSSEMFNAIQKNNVEVKEGFGFIKSAFIDQHFIKRKRLNRTISVVLENPHLLGIGIDESTCIVVYPDETFEVLGENQVMIFDATNCHNIKLDKNGNLGADNIRMHLLVNGDKFDLKSKKVIE